MKDLIKLLVLTMNQVFESDWRVCEPVGCKQWLVSIYEDFLSNYHTKICSYLKKCKPSKSDVTFLVIQFDIVSHLIKLVDFKLIIKNNFVIDQINELTVYWKYYPDRFYKILCQTLQNFHTFHFMTNFNGNVLIELYHLIFNGYTILVDFFHSSTIYRILCVHDLPKLSNVAHKFANFPIYKQLNITNLKIFDLIVTLLTTEASFGNKHCPTSINFLNECLESMNQLVKSNSLVLENEYKLRYFEITKISIEIIDMFINEKYPLMGLNQINMALDIIKNLIKFESILFLN